MTRTYHVSSAWTDNVPPQHSVLPETLTARGPLQHARTAGPRGTNGPTSGAGLTVCWVFRFGKYLAGREDRQRKAAGAALRAGCGSGR